MNNLVYEFACPVCKVIRRTDQPGEPLCTGPSEMRDDHDLTIMRLKSIQKTAVSPQFAERRAGAHLIMGDMTDDIARESRLILKRDWSRDG